MTGATETYVTTGDGCRLWTERSGAISAPSNAADVRPGGGFGFVLCHGGPGFWDTLAPIAAILADYGTVIRWDQRGGGRSQHQGPYTLARFVADLDAVRAAHGLDRVTVVGHSWGASLALNYAWDHPERVRSLVYISGAGLSWGGDWRREFHANVLKACSGCWRTSPTRAPPVPTSSGCSRRTSSAIPRSTGHSTPNCARWSKPT
jgi:proline iminopeptidase